MKLSDIRRRVHRLRRALAPTLPPPPGPVGPARVILFMPDNNTGPGSAHGEDRGPYSSRFGDVELVIFDPANPRPLSLDGQLPTNPPTGASE